MNIVLYVVVLHTPWTADVLWVFADKSKAITLRAARNEQLKMQALGWIPSATISIHDIECDGYLSLNSR